MDGALDLSYIEFVKLLGFVYTCCFPNLGSYYLLFLQSTSFCLISLISLSLPPPVMCILFHLIVSHKSLRLCLLFFFLFKSALEHLQQDVQFIYCIFELQKASLFKNNDLIVNILILFILLLSSFHLILFSFRSLSIFMTVF